MNLDRDDGVLDACLDEILGGRLPPDLTARILAAWTAQLGDSAEPDVLDACLHEVLGGHAPPDLTVRILDALETGDPEPPPILSGAYQAVLAADSDAPSVMTSKPALASRFGERPMLQQAVGLLIAASVVGLLIGGAMFFAPRAD